MASFILKTFKGGMADYENEGVPGSFKFGKNLDIRKKRDSLTCQQALADLTISGMTGLVNFFVPCSDGNTYAFCRNGQIFKIDASLNVTLVYTDSNEVGAGGIKGAAEWYENNAGTITTYLYWITDTRVNRKLIPGLSNWTDVNSGGLGTWPKTNLSPADWHTAGLGVGALNICNAQYMALVGYDSSYTNQSLDLLPNTIAKTFIERNGRNVVIGTDSKMKMELSPLVLWDTVSNNWLDKKSYPVKGINAMIDTDIPLMQVGDIGGLYYSDLINIFPILSFPGGGKCNPGATESDNGLALFGVYNNGTGQTGIYSYGKKRKNANHVLNLEYQLDCDEIGAVVKVGTDILLSYKSGSTYSIKKVNLSAKAQAVYQSLDLIPTIRGGDVLPTWEKIVITTSPMPSGTNIEAWRRIDKEGNFLQCNMEGGATQFTTLNGKEAVFYMGDKGKIGEVQFILNPSGNISPEILRAEVFFNINK